MTAEKKEVRPGSARARLESFEREQRGKRSIFVKLGLIFGLLVVVLVIQMMMTRFEKDRGWFDVPKNAAHLARKAKWDDLRAMISDDLVVEGAAIPGSDTLMNLIKSHGADGLTVYATSPHDYEAKGDQARIDFWVIWSRGDINKGTVVPIVQTWLVQALVVKEDEHWKAKRLIIRDCITPGGVDLDGLDRRLEEEKK